MQMRSLNSTDLFTMLDIVNKMGVEKVKDCFKTPSITELLRKDNGSGKMANAVAVAIGFEIMSLIISNIGNAKDDIFIFLADLTSQKKEEVEELPPAEFVKLIKELTQKDEFTDFLSQLSEFFK